jgi:hypothetical protein
MNVRKKQRKRLSVTEETRKTTKSEEEEAAPATGETNEPWGRFHDVWKFCCSHKLLDKNKVSKQRTTHQHVQGRPEHATP